MIMSLTVAYFGQLETELNKLDQNPSPIAPPQQTKTKKKNSNKTDILK